MWIVHSFFLLSCALFSLYGEETAENNLNSLNSLQADPDCIVANHVNVITGEFCVQDTDGYLMTQIPEPITRTYSSGRKGDKTFHQWWSLGIKGKTGIDDELRPYIKFKGQKLTFHSNSKAGRRTIKSEMWYHLTNTSQGIISGRTNPDNYVMIDGKTEKDQPKSEIRLLTPSGDIAYFCPSADSDHNYIVKEQKEYGDKIIYRYLPDTNIVKHLLAYSKDDTLIDTCRINTDLWESDKEKIESITTGNSENVYHFSKNKLRNGGSHFLLERVARKHAPDVWYEYRTVKGTQPKDGHLLSKIMKEGGEILNIEYYGQGEYRSETGKKEQINKQTPHLQRVYKLKGYDCFNKYYDQMTFWYDIFNRSIYTYAWDAANNLRTYVSYDGRLTRIEDYKGSSSKHRSADCSFYRSKKYFWGEGRKNPKRGHLVAQGIYDAKGSCSFCKKFTYDNRGNVVQERLHGNFTGNASLEQLDIHYVYTQDGRNLLKEASYPRYKLSYEYGQDHNKPLKEFVHAEGKIQKRTFYTYDSNNFLIEKTIDDGLSVQKESLEGVTERLIERFKPHGKYPYYLVKEHSFFCLNLSTGGEELLKRIEYTYDQRGFKTEEKVFDQNNAYSFSHKQSYSAYGQVAKSISPLGAVTLKEYDVAGNLIAEEGPEPGYRKEIQYARNNLPIKVTEYINGKVGLVKHLLYDRKGNLIQETDKYGNNVSYAYDEFGRKIATSYPAIAIGEESHQPCVEITEYDILDYPQSKKDVYGRKTEQKNTVYGKPYFIQHYDGKQEKYTYSIEGFQLQHIDKEGLIREQEVDWQGRPVVKRVYTSDKSYYQEHFFRYNTFHLIEEIDSLGNHISYRYDQAGRLVETIAEGKREAFSYDSLSRVAEHKITSAKNSLRIVKSYDVMDNLLEEKTYAQEELVKHVQYTYTPTGKKSSEIRFTANGEERSFIRYNERGDIIEEVDAEGKAIVHRHDYSFYNLYGQYCHKVTTILPSGKQLVSIRNPQEKEIILEEYDLVGNLAKTSTTFYNSLGNKIKKEEKSESGQKQQICWIYDNWGRLITVSENTSLTTLYYNEKGERSAVLLPDGRSLHYTYTADGQIAESRSSDGSIHYAFTYDTLGRVILAENKIANTSTQRTYDRKGHLASEKLENDLLLLYEWDAFEKLSCLTLPDSSKIRWTYKGNDIHTIERIDALGNLLYVHTYSLYDTFGRVLETKLAGDLGTLSFSYDNLGRLQSQQSLYFTEQVVSRDSLGNSTCITGFDSLGSFHEEYQYDFLSRLTMEKGFAEHTYSYDLFHNLLQKDKTLTTLNEDFQITDFGDISYSYDLNGCLKEIHSPEGKILLFYDALGRLCQVERGGKVTRYFYDAFGRRIKKVNGTSCELYLYQQECEIGSYDEEGCHSLRVLGSGKGAEIAAAVAIEIGGTAYVPFHDMAGNVRQLINLHTKETAETLRYSAFGEQLGSYTLSPWRFSSKRFDFESGLTYFGKRYYLPVLGRWITKDPLGDVDGLNLYAYVHNNPLNYFDLWGERKLGDYFRAFKRELAIVTAISLMILSAQGNKVFYGYEGLLFENHFDTPPVGTKRSAVGKLQGTVEDPKHYIITINGIYSDEDSCRKYAETLQKYAGGRDIHIVYNKSYGTLWDPLEAICNNLGYRTLPSLALEKMIRKILKHNPDAEILIIGHSQGCMDIRDTMPAVPKEYQRRCTILAIAPGGYIDRTYCKDVKHLVCDQDPVTYIHWTGRKKAFKQGTIESCAAIKGDVFCHFREAEIYRNKTEEFVKKFINAKEH